jgi:hypothetical protein
MASDDSNSSERNRTDDKPETDRTRASGREVFVTKDESGVTSLAEDEDAADPRVTSGEVGDSESHDREDHIDEDKDNDGDR